MARVPEAQMPLDASMNVERLRAITKLALVAPGGARQEQHAPSFGHRLPIPCDVLHRDPSLIVRRRIITQQLLHRGREERGIAGQLGALIGASRANRPLPRACDGPFRRWRARCKPENFSWDSVVGRLASGLACTSALIMSSVGSSWRPHALPEIAKAHGGGNRSGCARAPSSRCMSYCDLQDPLGNLLQDAPRVLMTFMGSLR